jgi:hypothetical protein
MRAYLIRRLLALIPTMFFATLIVFCVIRLIPGDIIDLMISQHDFSDIEITRESLEKTLGLDVPIYIQYFRWIKGIILHGDLGKSLWTETQVSEEVLDRLPVTLELAVIALVIGLVISIPIGVYSAIRQDTAGDYAGRTFSILGLAIPGFWLGTMIVVYPSLWWGWSPAIELVPFSEDPWENLKTFLIPGALMGLAMSKNFPYSGSFDGAGHVCRDHADDPGHDAGGAQTGLYPDGLGQGIKRKDRHYPTCPQKCPYSGDHPDRFAVTRPDRGCRGYGAHIRAPGSGPVDAGSHFPERLSHCYGLDAHPWWNSTGYQSSGRSELWLSGSQGPVQVKVPAQPPVKKQPV